MKNRFLQVRVDSGFVSKLEHLKKANGYRTISETVRGIVERDYTSDNELKDVFEELNKLIREHDDTLVEAGVITDADRNTIPEFMWRAAVRNAKDRT